MAHPTTNRYYQNGRKQAVSNNTWTVNVRIFHTGGVPMGASLAGLTPRIIARFLSKIRVGRPNECWLWQAGTHRNGYGQFNAGRFANRKQDNRYAHRLAFELATGVSPESAVVMHACDTPACCNPFHLRLGSQADNVRDAADKGHYEWRNQPQRKPRRKAA